ncbi:MAG: metal-dependent hydrolase [Myxococcota bacterium]
MDTITQALLGATVAEAGFGKKLGHRAMIVGALCGVLPDLDIVSGMLGPWASMIHHRGITHSIFFAAAAAPLIGWAAWRANKRQGTHASWAHLAWWAVVTHPLLDLFTSYGTQLLAPFSDRRFALDAIPIVDPIYSAALLLALLVALVARRKPRIGQIAASSALVFTTSYLLFGWQQSATAKQLAREQLAGQGFEVQHMRAQPVMLVWMWRIAARNAEGDLRVGSLSTWQPTPIDFRAMGRPDDPLVARALQSERGKVFQWFADGMVGVRIERHEGGTSVWLDDQRYGSALEPDRSFWGARAEFGPDGELIDVTRERRSMKRFRSELGLTWDMMWKGANRLAVGAGPAGTVAGVPR